MAVEFEQGKAELLEKLRGGCVANLRYLQDNRVEAEFSFRDYWGWEKTDSAMQYRSPILRQISEMLAAPNLETWAIYTYKNGSLTGEVIQNQSTRNLYGEVPRSVGVVEDYSINDIPFDKFSEEYLLKAAKAIESHLPRDRNPKRQVA